MAVDEMAVGVADGMAVELDDRMAVGLDDRTAVGDVGLDFFLALEPSLLALDLRLTPLAALEFLLALTPAGQSEQAPIKMVNGRAWSPGIYWSQPSGIRFRYSGSGVRPGTCTCA